MICNSQFSVLNGLPAARRHDSRLSFSKPILLCFAILLFQFSTSLRAQQPWNYYSIEEACLGDAYLISPPGEICLQVESKAVGKVEYNAMYHISGPYVSRRQNYIRFQSATADFRLPEVEAEKLLPYLVSKEYWQQRFDAIRRWDFVDASRVCGFLDVDTTGMYGRYSIVSWLRFDFQPSEDWPVFFTVALDGGEAQRLSLGALERLAQWGVFATYADWQIYADRNEDVRRRKEEMMAALQRHEDSLSNVSMVIDRQVDSMYNALESDSLAAVAEKNRAEVEQHKARMNRDEIFFMSINPARSEYMFGLELNLYNCFAKTITKIEITVTPYNDRSRVQEDKFGRSTRTVRCMGPITPGSPAQYSLDELYWNDKGKIKYMRVTGIVFHFTDGTTKSYSGYNRIMEHCLKF